MKKIFLISLFAIISFSGCKKSEDITSNAIFLKTGWNGFFGPCFNSFYDSEVVIRSQKEYELFFENNRRTELPPGHCEGTPPPEIDFNKYTLIGKGTYATGCGQEFNRTLIQKGNKTLRYHIVVISKGGCLPLRHEMNWALVPKIKNRTEVIFEVENRHE